MTEQFQNQNNRRTYKFVNGATNIPHPKKMHTGGQDAFYANDNILVMADGVGSWARYNIDSGLYSRELCRIIEQLYLSENRRLYLQKPELLLEEAVRRNQLLGSSTITIITLDEQTGALRSVVMGDSSFIQYRDSKQIYVSQELVHSFNNPYQVGTKGTDLRLAHSTILDSLDGDLIVLASDGVWDNLRKKDVKKVVGLENVQEIAKTIAQGSYFLSLRKGYQSPFYDKAQQAGVECQKTGKPDDISVLVSRVRCI